MKDEECRLCLAALDPDDCGYSIAKNARFRKALEQVFTFKISFEAADLPEYTCKQCSWNVLDFQSFSELVKANQEKLQERSQRVDGHGKSIAEIAYVDDEARSEGSATADDSEPVNSFQSDDLERSVHNVQEVYEIPHPDHVYAATADQNADQRCSPVVICEEYLITANDAEPADYTSNDEPYDSNEPPTKKQKLPTGTVLASENNNVEPHRRSDANNVPFSSKTFPCEQCDRVFESKWQVEYHKQEHVISKCMFCKKPVPLKHYNLHMTTHIGDFNCNLCNKKFLSQRDFKYHKKACKEPR